MKGLCCCQWSALQGAPTSPAIPTLFCSSQRVEHLPRKGSENCAVPGGLLADHSLSAPPSRFPNPPATSPRVVTVQVWPMFPCGSPALARGQTSLPRTGLSLVCSLPEVCQVGPLARWLPECFSQPASQAFRPGLRGVLGRAEVSLELRPRSASRPELQASRAAGRVWSTQRGGATATSRIPDLFWEHAQQRACLVPQMGEWTSVVLFCKSVRTVVLGAVFCSVRPGTSVVGVKT